MIKNKVISDLNEHIAKMIDIVVEAETYDSDFNIIRELIEQLAGEIEVIEEND